MARSAVGAITLTDIKDGIHPISVVLGNQSHTFAADPNGTVVSAEVNKFSCEVFVYIGDSRATYDSSVSPANNTYKVTAASTPVTWTTSITEVSNQAVVSVNTVPTGTSNTTANVVLTIEIKNYLGNVTTTQLVISLAKAIEGHAGQIIELTPSRQTFQFSEDGVTTDSDIVIPVRTAGNVGALSVFYSRNGSTNWATLAQGTGVNKAKSIDIDGTGGDDHVTISKENFGTSDVFSIKVEGAAGGVDVVSIIKIQDGNTGSAALLVSITSSTGGFVFKNNAGAVKTLTAEVYDMKDGSEITSNLSYNWYKDNVAIGQTTKSISVSASDVVDGGSNQYSCTVTLAEV